MEEIKNLIKKQVDANSIYSDGNAFEGYQKTYFSTNENIKDYLNLVNFRNKEKALTVLASGDQVFNLINKGILNIDTFDINKLSEYYVFGLRYALIQKYNYKTYLNVVKTLMNKNTSFEEINDILFGLLPYMDNKYRMFWTEILNYNYNIQKNNKTKLNLIEMLFINIQDKSYLNNYLIDEKEYNKLKNNLYRTNISYKCTNAINLDKEFTNKYDLILLSNILDYFNNYLGKNWDLKKYIDKLDKITNKDAIIFINYIHNYYSKHITRNNDLIDGTGINLEDFKELIIKKLPLYNNKRIGDGIIIKKK